MADRIIHLVVRSLVGLLAGLLGGIIFALAIGPFYNIIIHLLLSAFLGVLFGLFVGPRLHTGGASLVWGEAYGLVWWILGYLTLFPIISGEGLYWSVEKMREFFFLLLGQVIAYGAALGLGYYYLMRVLMMLQVIPEQNDKEQPAGPRPQELLAPRLRAILIGGFNGLFGGWVFLLGIDRSFFFPAVAGLVRSDSALLGGMLHYAIAIFIGMTFGFLFYRDIRSSGSSLVWGMTYGITWWMLGEMTLGFLFFLRRPDWNLHIAQSAFTPLIAHILYGALLGLLYAIFNRVWNALFVDSDPLNRTRESLGTQSVRALLMGQVAGIIGGLLFTIVMVATDSLPRVASLVGGSSAVLGFLVHCLIAFIVGSSYGILFRNEAYSYGSGMGWGLLYGFLWWLLGPGTLFFMILRQPIDWSLAGTVARYPALVGHLLYGMGLGLVFQFLVRRYDTHRRQAGAEHHHHTSGTPAAALWAVTLLIGILLPLLLGG